MSQTPDQRKCKKSIYAKYYYAQNKDKIQARNRKRYAQNPEKVKEIAKKSYAKCMGKAVPKACNKQIKLSWNDICPNGMGMNIYKTWIDCKMAGKHLKGKGCDNCNKDLRSFLDETNPLPPFYGYLPKDASPGEGSLLCKECLDKIIETEQKDLSPFEKIKANLDKEKSLQSNDEIWERSNKTHKEFLGQPPELQDVLDYTETQINEMSVKEYIAYVTPIVTLRYTDPEMPSEIKNKFIASEIKLLCQTKYPD